MATTLTHDSKAYSWATFPIISENLGAFGNFLLHGDDLVEYFLQSLLTPHQFGVLMCTGRSVYLAITATRRALTDRLVFYRRLQERLTHPGPWWEAVGRSTQLHPHNYTEFVVPKTMMDGSRPPVEDDYKYVSPTTVSSYTPANYRFPVIEARINPNSRIPPFRRSLGSGSFEIDLSQMIGIGTLSITLDGNPPQLSYTGRDQLACWKASFFEEDVQVTLAEILSAKRQSKIVPSHWFPVTLFRQSIQDLLVPQGRDVVEYLLQLNTMKDQSDLDTLLKRPDTGAMIEGVFIMIGATAWRYAEAPHFDENYLELCYLGPTFSQTVHSVR